MKALIASLGGSSAPVVKSIQTHAPDFVCFLTTPECVEAIGTIKTETGLPFRDYKVVMDDKESLVRCYERAVECCAAVEREGFAPADVRVDYTGGTKSMSAALVLATIYRGYTYSYVGGRERTKDGRGVVVDGAEEVFEGRNPWDVLAVMERDRIEWAVNHYAYGVALNYVDEMVARHDLSPRIHAFFKTLKPLVQAWLHWDRFQHKRIGRSLSEGLAALKDYRAAADRGDLDGLIAGVEDNKRFLDAFQQASRGFTDICEYHVADLIANAERRAEEGKFDDAIARLYRALEMAAQVALRKRPEKIDTAAVPPEAVPDELRENFLTRYLDPESRRLKLPLFASYRLLHAYGDPVGAHFMERQEGFEKILSARNSSILAHGVHVYDRGAFDSFMQLMHADGTHFPKVRFPRLSLGGLTVPLVAGCGGVG